MEPNVALTTSQRGKKIKVNHVKKNEQAIRVKFINNEFPKADVQFTTHDKVKGKGGKVRLEPRRWHLMDGQEYVLPLHIIAHINALTIPESSYEVDEKTKQIVSRREGSRHRFTCIPVNMDTLVANQGAAKGKDEPTPSGSGPDTKTGDEALEAAAA